MGKVAALVLTEEEKTQDFPPSQLVPLSPISSAIPLPPTFVGTFPSGKVFGCPKSRMHNSNYPTDEFAKRLGERIAAPVCALVRNDPSSYGSATVFPNGPAHFNPSRSDTDSCPPGHTSRHLCCFTLLHWATPNFTHPAERPVEWQAVPLTSKAGPPLHFSQTPSFGQYKSRTSRRASLRPHSSSR